MMYSVRPMAGLSGLGAAPESRLCQVGEEFCDDWCVRTWLLTRERDEKYKCLTDAQANYLIDLCKSVKARKITSEQARAQGGAMMDDPCSFAMADCRNLVSRWMARNPADAACLTRAQLEQLANACVLNRQGKMSSAKASGILREMVAACAAQPPEPPPPAPAPPPPVQIVQPVAAPAPASAPIHIVEEHAEYTPDVVRSQDSGRKPVLTWGPIVGALLVVGGAAYLLR